MIHPEAKRMAEAFRSAHKREPSVAAVYIQVVADDGWHHWLSLSIDDLKALSRDEDLQAVCQAMLVNRGLIKLPTNEENHEPTRPISTRAN